jgi:basic membrane protein A
VLYINSWWDPVKEGQAAEALLDQGADVIATNLSAASAMIAAEDRGKASVGFQIDMLPNVPQGHLTSVVFQWDTFLRPTFEKIIAGKWEPQEWGAFDGIELGVVALSPLNEKIPADARTRVDAALDALASSEITPFDGPLYKQDCTMVIDAGQTLDDGQLWGMDYPVSGSIGNISTGE